MEAQPGASEDEFAAAEVRAAVFASLFQLLDRDRSGYADEADVVAALQCQFGSEARAQQTLARVSEEGHVDEAKLKQLIESVVPQSSGESPLRTHERVMRLVLAIVR